MPSLRADLHRLAAQLIDDILTAVKGASLDELAGNAPSRARPAASSRHEAEAASGATLTPEQIARAVLALPAGRNRIRVIEHAVAKEALAVTKGNVSAASRLLGIERKALERRIARYKI